jgi:hypothetical protein
MGSVSVGLARSLPKSHPIKKGARPHAILFGARPGGNCTKADRALTIFGRRDSGRLPAHAIKAAAGN